MCLSSLGGERSPYMFVDAPKPFVMNACVLDEAGPISLSSRTSVASIKARTANAPKQVESLSGRDLRSGRGTTLAMKHKIPKPVWVEHALEVAGLTIIGHPTVVWPFILIECRLEDVEETSVNDVAAGALSRWANSGVSWNQVGNRLLVFVRQQSNIGRPRGPNKIAEEQVAEELALRDAGLSYQQIREKLYPGKHIEPDAIKQRVRRYRIRTGQVSKKALRSDK
jgi:hypothetical protein